MYITSLDEQRSQPLLLDIATCADQEPTVLTEGLTDKEQDIEDLVSAQDYGTIMEKYPSDWSKCSYLITGWLLKAYRERSFPLRVIRGSLDITVTRAEASKEVDKTRKPAG